MLAAVGTLLAGLVAVATFAVSQNWFSRDPVEPEPTTANGSPLPKLDGVVQWGPDTLILESSVDFDTTPPDREVSGLGSDTYLFDDLLTSPYNMVKWTAAKAPAQNDCAKLLATHGTGNKLAYETGHKFCVKTDKARIVYFEVVGQTPSGPELRVTVWKQRIELD